MSDTYFCAKTGAPFEADWDVECECTTCLPLDYPNRSSRQWVRKFKSLWASYRQALSVPFSLDRTEDERIKAEVERCFEALNRLAKEGT